MKNKRILLMVFLLITSFLLVACAGSKKPEKKIIGVWYNQEEDTYDPVKKLYAEYNGVNERTIYITDDFGFGYIEQIEFFEDGTYEMLGKTGAIEETRDGTYSFIHDGANITLDENIPSFDVSFEGDSLFLDNEEKSYFFGKKIPEFEEEEIVGLWIVTRYTRKENGKIVEDLNDDYYEYNVAYCKDGYCYANGDFDSEGIAYEVENGKLTQWYTSEDEDGISEEHTLVYDIKIENDQLVQTLKVNDENNIEYFMDIEGMTREELEELEKESVEVTRYYERY